MTRAIGSDGPPGGPRHRLAVGRVRPYAPRAAGTLAIALFVRDDLLLDLAQEGITPSLRGVFYVLVDKRLIEKSEKAYKRWKKQSMQMRKGGWIAMDAFSDASREHYGGDEPDGRPSDLFIDVAAAYCLRAWAGQPEVAELWHEADTHKGIFRPVADEFRVRCVSTHGDASLDLLQKSAEFINARYTERGQRTCILYFGDHDAAGLTISEGLHEHLCEVHMIPEACRVVRVAVTLEQITDPRHPLPTRFSEHNERDKKAEWYERQYPGVGYVDLDAIAPRTLVTLARAAIQATIADPAAWREQAQRERALRRDLLDAIERHSAEYDALWRASGEEER